MSVKRYEIYKCKVAETDCDCLVEMLSDCDMDCAITCCDQPITKLEAKTGEQEGKEKHVPVVEKVDGGYKVTVGSVPHPMQDDHWIQWIELQAGDTLMRQYLNSGQAPEAVFKTDATDVCVREHCNKHGLWKA